MAQSSVTLFGVVDATYAVGRGNVANKTQLTNSGLNSSRLGFRGTEDLGGGIAASFWLEAGLANDDGQGAGTNTNNQSVGPFNATTGANGLVRPGSQGLTFNRRSTVSLSGGFGEVRLGRDYTPQFWNLTVFEPFGTNGVGTSQTLNSSMGGPVTVRASNSIGYFLPGAMGGLYGQFQYYMGENLSNVANKKDGNGLAARLGYANGPINVAAAYSQTKYMVTGDIKTTNFGAQYDLGVVNLMGHYTQDRISGASAGKGKGWLLGLTAPMGAGELRAAISTYEINSASKPETDKIAVGYVHNLSKRTAVYTTYARLKNKGGASQALNGASTGANGKSSGLDVGLRHSF